MTCDVRQHILKLKNVPKQSRLIKQIMQNRKNAKAVDFTGIRRDITGQVSLNSILTGLDLHVISIIFMLLFWIGHVCFFSNEKFADVNIWTCRKNNSVVS